MQVWISRFEQYIAGSLEQGIQTQTKENLCFYSHFTYLSIHIRIQIQCCHGMLNELNCVMGAEIQYPVYAVSLRCGFLTALAGNSNKYLTSNDIHQLLIADDSCDGCHSHPLRCSCVVISYQGVQEVVSLQRTSSFES